MAYGGGINFWRNGDLVVFGWVPSWMTKQTDLESVHRVMADVFGRVVQLNDDRLLVMIGALFVEEQLESLLDEVLKLRIDLSWAAKTDVLRGLKLVPSRLLDAVDFIRSLRNKFAHQLATSQFADLDPIIVNKLRTEFLADIYQGPTPPATTDSEKYRNLVFAVSGQLAAFRLPARELAGFLHSDQFTPALKAHLGKSGAPD